MTYWYFSSHDLPENERLERARDFYARVANINVEPYGDAPFQAEAHIHVLPGATVVDLARSPCRVRRTRAQAAESDDLALFISTEGRFRIQHEGGEPADFGPGEAYLSPADCAARSVLSPRSVDVVFPREDLMPLLARPDRVLKRPVPVSAALHLLTNYASTLARQVDPLPPAMAQLAAAHLRDLTVAALGGTRDAQEQALRGGVRAARLQAVKDDIMANLTQPWLTAQTIASRHRISSRYLRALFRDEDTSFTDFVLQRRLEHSRRLIADPTLAYLPIGRLAMDSGFGDLSWFNRSLKRRFGMTPSEARELALAEVSE